MNKDLIAIAEKVAKENLWTCSVSNPLHRHAKVRRPTTMMSMNKARAHRRQGKQPVYTYRLESREQLEAILKELLKNNARGTLNVRIPVVDSKEKKVLSPLSKAALRRRMLAKGLRIGGKNRSHYSVQLPGFHSQQDDIEIELGRDPDGTPVIRIYSRTREIPPYKVQHIVGKRKKKRVNDDDDDDDDPGHVFIKEPYNDDMLINAMMAADEGMLDENHKKLLKWKEDSEYHEKQFHDHHLLVCLFFYILVHKLNSNPDFYSCQRKQFHEFVCRRLPRDFDIKGDRHFSKSIDSLQLRRDDFKQYLKDGKRPDTKRETGEANMAFWYDIYQKAAVFFEKVLKPELVE